jgi:hypothetical protein
MRCTVIFMERVATFLLQNMNFLAELQPEIIIFLEIVTSCNIPGGFLKIIPQIRSKGFLGNKTLDPPLLYNCQINLR